jgi:hypothetical protein
MRPLPTGGTIGVAAPASLLLDGCAAAASAS